MTLTLEQAIQFAAFAHMGQVDKQEQPYILHALAVMMSVPDYLRIPALFHDIVEDTTMNYDNLLDIGTTARDVELVEILTRRKGETRADYINRILADPDAILIKRADMRHNMGRIETIDDPDTRERLEKKYRRDISQMAIPDLAIKPDNDLPKG